MTNERTFRKQTFINDGRVFEKIIETKASIKRSQEQVKKENLEVDYEFLKKQEEEEIKRITNAFDGVDSRYDLETGNEIWYKNGRKMTKEEIENSDYSKFSKYKKIK